jgi:hypothetical protein
MGGESGLGMISSFKNNAAMLRKKRLFKRPGSFASIKGGYLMEAGSLDHLRRATPKELLDIRKKVRAASRMRTIKSIVMTAVLAILLLSILLYLLK